MSMASFTLKKQDRLKSRKLIDQLFTSGESVFVYPIKLMYMPVSELDSPLKMAVTVPKRHFKLAIDRNHLKRKIREAYRLNKSPLQDKLRSSSSHFILMFIYVGKGVEEYAIIEKAVKKLLFKMLNV